MTRSDLDAVFSRIPASPNCVSSLAPASDRRHHIAPLERAGSPDAWRDALRAAALALPGARLVRDEPFRLAAECVSRRMRWVDDLDLAWDASSLVVHVRSASRVGWWDLGVNRRRVERLRAALNPAGDPGRGP